MAGAAPRTEARPLTRGARVARATLIGVSLAFLGLLLLAPLGAVLAQALAKGWRRLARRASRTLTRSRRSA